MKKAILSLFISTGLLAGIQAQDRLMTQTGHISFYSHMVAEDITANNYKVTGALTPSTGSIVFSVPMQGFEFPKAKMQQHYNSPKFLDTKQFPKGKFKGQIENISEVDFSKEGTYKAVVSGDLTIHGVTKKVKEEGTFKVAGGKVFGSSKFKITLADYNITFAGGKPATNIAKDVALTIEMNYE